MAKAMGKYKPGLALGTAILVQLEQQCRMHCSQNGKMNRLPIESVI
jgi:hypothetical protein